jgi:hypothetical protein
MDRRLITVSKYLAKYLRHMRNPDRAGDRLTGDRAGTTLFGISPHPERSRCLASDSDWRRLDG